MSRPIKFRAWNEVLKKWVEPNAVHVNGVGILGFIDGVQGRFHEAAPHYKFTQFTGLHDKNGKEIWEGDIVKHGNGTIQKVIWIKCETFSGIQILGHGASNLEVLGNVYEHPELLK